MLMRADQCWVPMRKTPLLNEQHSGALTGENKKALAEKHGVRQVMSWRRDYDQAPPAMSASNPLQRAMLDDGRYTQVRLGGRFGKPAHPNPIPQPTHPGPVPHLPTHPALHRSLAPTCPSARASRTRACGWLARGVRRSLRHSSRARRCWSYRMATRCARSSSSWRASATTR